MLGGLPDTDRGTDIDLELGSEMFIGMELSIDCEGPQLFDIVLDVSYVLPDKLSDNRGYTEEAGRSAAGEEVQAKFNPGRKWTIAEDDKLVGLMRKHGHEWTKIAKEFQDKTAKQLKERWLNQLNPKVVDDAFTVDEDMKLVLYIREFGRSWSKICKLMPGRSELMVKNRYHSFLRRRIAPTQFEPETDMDVNQIFESVTRGIRRAKSKKSFETPGAATAPRHACPLPL